MRYLIVFLLSFLISCSRPPDPHIPWYPHKPVFWHLTPDGHMRDAGPFASVEAGYATDEEIDTAIDVGFKYLTERTGLVPPNMPVGLNDDYVMWSTAARAWCAGLETTGDSIIHVTLWSRIETAEDPGPCWISRPPGNYWGLYYPNWRHTGKPLTPAVAHELLHACIGDPDHTSWEWIALGE